MTSETQNLLVGKVLCGDANGGKVLFTGIDLVNRETKEGPQLILQLSGEANAYLVHNKNPERGALKLSETVAITIEQNVDKDAAIQVGNLSKALELTGEDALDGTKEDWVERFMENHPKSVVKLLREKGIFVKTTLKTNWEKAIRYGESPFYYNPHFMDSREAFGPEALAKIKAAREARMGGSALAGVA